MTHFSNIPKDKLREYQSRAIKKRTANYESRYINAYIEWVHTKDIHKIAKKYKVTRDGAYKMVRKGREIVDDKARA